MAGAKKYAYTTLITRASYLAGVIILAYTLKKQGSKYPLVVYYTANLKSDAIKALELEATNLNLIVQPCEQLLPRENVKVHLIAERFADTWTKLRVFDAAVFGYDAVCYLDADMAIFKDMDSVFSHADDLPVDWIAANHACVCNLDKDAWAPEDWTKENCAYTPLQHPEALSKPTQPTLESRGTYHLLNSGMFLYHPAAELWDAMIRYFNESEKLWTYKFPDQDFLADFFRNRWRGLGWQYNALKTMRYWHHNIWRDDEVVCLHYIIDKPWAVRVNANGTAGFKGEDGVTHGWWWEEYASWVQTRKSSGDEEVLQLVGKHVAREDGTENSDPDMRAIAATTAQSFAGNKAPAEHGTQDNGHQQAPEHPMKKKSLGERGHGAVVHSR